MRTRNRTLSGILVVALALFACNNTPQKKDTNSAGNSEIMQKLFRVETSAGLFVVLPTNKNVKCKIDKLVEYNTHFFATGKYKDGVERGEIFVNYKKQTPLNFSTNNKNYYLIPFIVSNQGSGNFHYLGLFSLNKKDASSEHISSRFLGDRIKIETIKQVADDTAEISIKVHSDKQALSEEPSETKIISVKVDKNGFSETEK
jgi:hypothetical protein